MSGGGGGGSDTWRPEPKPGPRPKGKGENGGGGIPPDPCNITETTTLNSPNRTIVASLRAGDTLAVVFQAGPPQRLVAEQSPGVVAGSITSPSIASDHSMHYTGRPCLGAFDPRRNLSGPGTAAMTAITIAGGVYHEHCIWPAWDQLYGSAGRAAAALVGHVDAITLRTYARADTAAAFQPYAAYSYPQKLTVHG
jgi:hypothetical protein